MSLTRNFLEQEKKDVVDRLMIPRELVRLVKDFLYHTEKTSSVIQNIRKKKDFICNLIANHSSYESSQNNPEEDWFFIMTIPLSVMHKNIVDGDSQLRAEYLFGASNCKVCGNYKYTYRFYGCVLTMGLSNKNTCKCNIIYYT